MSRLGGREPLYFRFAIDEVRPPERDVEIVLGYGARRSPAAVRAAIEKVLSAPADLWSIEGGCLLFEPARVDALHHRLLVGTVGLEVGEIVSRQLRRAEGVAVFLCTAGPGISNLSVRLMTASRDPLTGYVADTVGSLVVERAIDRIQDRLEARMQARGLRLTNRYSPGHCGWDLAEQRKLFRLLPRGFCGVRLAESCFMHPIKSVSGVIGLGAAVRRQPYGCKQCDREQCLYRRRQRPHAAA